jgi:Zn-dependent alcohol dehydrogenase
MATMTAAVVHEPGGPEVLKLEQRTVPTPKRGEVLIRVKAFGLRDGFKKAVEFAEECSSRSSNSRV